MIDGVVDTTGDYEIAKIARVLGVDPPERLLVGVQHPRAAHVRVAVGDVHVARAVLVGDPRHGAGERGVLEAAVAKCFATDMAMKVTTDAVQILGGYGYIQDYKVERYMRDAKVGQIVEGTNQIQRLLIARELLKDGAPARS